MLVVMLGVILLILIKKTPLTMGSALVAALFGFFLADTGLSGPIGQTTDSVMTTLQSMLS